MEIWRLIEKISLAHEQMRNKFTYIKARGNDSLVTNTSTKQSLDFKRMDQKKTASPSKFDKFSPATHDTTFTQELIRLVSEEEKADLLLLQKFVANIFEHATKANNATKVKATTSAILSWTKQTRLTKRKYALTTRYKYTRPPTDSDNEVTADQPILQAVVCRIIGILASSKEKEVLHKQEDGVTTEQSTAG
jgi:hypothetical protein